MKKGRRRADDLVAYVRPKPGGEGRRFRTGHATRGRGSRRGPDVGNILDHAPTFQCVIDIGAGAASAFALLPRFLRGCRCRSCKACLRPSIPLERDVTVHRPNSAQIGASAQAAWVQSMLRASRPVVTGGRTSLRIKVFALNMARLMKSRQPAKC